MLVSSESEELMKSGTEAGQTVPHSHFHIIPRLSEEGGQARDANDIGDVERKNIALGEGPRVKLNDDEGRRLIEAIKEKIKADVDKMSASGELGGADDCLYIKFGVGGLKL